MMLRLPRLLQPLQRLIGGVQGLAIAPKFPVQVVRGPARVYQFSTARTLSLSDEEYNSDNGPEGDGNISDDFDSDMEFDEEHNEEDDSVAEMDEFGRVYSTGRRKTSVARVWIKEGSGQFLINGKRAPEYFQPMPREHCMSPFMVTGTAGDFDVWCTVKGGGTMGQAGAIRLGVSRCLNLWVPALRQFMKPEGMMKRDARRVERKKPGQKKARKKYQWVKR